MTTYAETPWATTAIAPQHWPEAGTVDPAALARYLSAATDACRDYAPILDAAAIIPAGYVIATCLHARDLHSAMLRDSADVIGVGDYAIRARPLSAAVKQALRPETRRPTIG